ncbi:unnamed protein product [Protopolystoma xenopodis]|uniref:Uncharacterized protein n=1 Tax=Protopolystoma xenopodis TaxID=117903 RepID=A0A3S5CS18_9PLAT|nr:unnamed protein product [Protopolystoma xenopodis]
MGHTNRLCLPIDSVAHARANPLQAISTTVMTLNNGILGQVQQTTVPRIIFNPKVAINRLHNGLTQARCIGNGCNRLEGTKSDLAAYVRNGTDETRVSDEKHASSPKLQSSRQLISLPDEDSDSAKRNGTLHLVSKLHCSSGGSGTGEGDNSISVDSKVKLKPPSGALFDSSQISSKPEFSLPHSTGSTFSSMKRLKLGILDAPRSSRIISDNTSTEEKPDIIDEIKKGFSEKEDIPN